MNTRIETRLVLKRKVKIALSKFLLTIIIFLIGMILVKQNSNFKKNIEENLYEKSLPFQKLKTYYEKYFGKALSIDKITKKEQAVFSEKLSYEKIKESNNGVKLKVADNYMVPVLESGVVVYIGKKDEYNTIIVEQVNGIDTIYSNVKINNIKLYDYVEKGELLGEVYNNELFLSFQKDGKYLDYKEYI